MVQYFLVNFIWRMRYCASFGAVQKWYRLWLVPRWHWRVTGTGFTSRAVSLDARLNMVLQDRIIVLSRGANLNTILETESSLFITRCEVDFYRFARSKRCALIELLFVSSLNPMNVCNAHWRRKYEWRATKYKITTLCFLKMTQSCYRNFPWVREFSKNLRTVLRCRKTRRIFLFSRMMYIWRMSFCFPCYETSLDEETFEESTLLHDDGTKRRLFDSVRVFGKCH